jgi:hypothetical protein
MYVCALNPEALQALYFMKDTTRLCIVCRIITLSALVSHT